MAVPVIDDVIVPRSNLETLISRIRELADKHHIELAIWGHAAEANLHVQPLLDLSKLGDRQRVFKLMDELYRSVIGMGGSIAAENNEGRLRAPYVALQLGEEIVAAYDELRKAADPHGILNPGVKTGTDSKQLVNLLAKDFSIVRHADYLPRM